MYVVAVVFLLNLRKKFNMQSVYSWKAEKAEKDKIFMHKSAAMDKREQGIHAPRLHCLARLPFICCVFISCNSFHVIR